MKKLLLITFIALFTTALTAQDRTTFLNENFDGTTMPAGWSIMGLGTTNWSVSPSANAGGSANELKLNYNPSFNGISRLVSPAVDLTGVSSVVFMFKHYLDNYSGSHTLGIATSSDNGATWNNGWSEVYSNDEQYSVSQNITTEDIGNSSVLFCIYYSGNSYNIDNWYFDDISVFSMEELDASLNTINIPDFIGAGDVPVNFTISNLGSTPITSIEANYQFEGHEMFTETFTTDIASLASESFTFANITNLVPGSYNLDVNIVAVNGEEDNDPSNNSLSKTIGTALGTAQKIPMIEHFSSSTCGPCVGVNQTMLALTNNNPGKYTYTKYCMNWPSPGDPYYTEEGGVRRDYYGVNAVPDIAFDGISTSNAPVSQNLLDQHYNTPAFAEIRGAFNVEGNTITITADAMSYVDMTDIKFFIAVNEKTTTENTGSNGEAEFHHVMMKMLENGQGNNVNITAGDYARVEFTFDMSSTHVEEMSDLEVSAWLQNMTTKEIFNSHFLYENMPHPYPIENLLLAENDDNTMTATWDAAQGGNATGYNVYVNSVLVAENTTDLSYTFDSQSGNFYIVEVCAVYGEEITSVKVVTEMLNTLNVNEKEANTYSIFPNPANGFVKVVANDNIQTISIYNCVGALIDRINTDANNIEINTAKYNTGVYFINVIQENGMNNTKKLVITH